MASVWLPVVVLAVLYLATLADANGCPDNTWTAYKGQSCVKVFADDKQSWTDARESCRTLGGDLVRIGDPEMNTFIKDLLGNKERYWIGLATEENSGPYMDTDGKALGQMSFQNWRRGEPKTRAKTRSCVEMIGNKRGTWKVKPCAYTRRYVCQHDLEKVEKWDDLKVTWGRPGMPNAQYFFNSMPRTASDARDQGFVKISDCDVRANWRGSRFVQNDDHSLVLLYDINGYIAGIQTIVPSGQKNGYPFPNIQPPFSKDGKNFVLTAYFVEPDIICTSGRSAQDFAEQGTGTSLFIQSGVDPETDRVRIPLKESDIAQTPWIKGKCMPTMGVHYWFDTSADMDCNNFYPVFLMYNNGRLNAFGWAMATDLPSKRLEHPSQMAFPMFFDPVPKCLYNYDFLSTLHIYMTSDILANKC